MICFDTDITMVIEKLGLLCIKNSAKCSKRYKGIVYESATCYYLQSSIR